MRLAPRLGPVLLLLALPACDRAADDVAAPGTVMPDEARALSEAAAMLDSPRAGGGPAAAPPIQPSPAPAAPR